MIFYSHVIKFCSCLINIHTVLNLIYPINSAIKDQVVNRNICAIFDIDHAWRVSDIFSGDCFSITVDCDVLRNGQDALGICFTISINDSIFYYSNNVVSLCCLNSIFQGCIWCCTNKSFHFTGCCIFKRITVDGRIYHCNILAYDAYVTVKNSKITICITICISVCHFTSNITVVNNNTTIGAIRYITSNSRIVDTHITAGPIDNIAGYCAAVKIKISIATVMSRGTLS